MARVAGVNIPDNKHVEYSLPYINGIGLSLAKKVCSQAGVKLGTKVSDLKEANSEDHQDIKDCIGGLEVKTNEFIKGADKRYASKLSERIVYTMVGAVLLAVLYFILRKAGIE